MKDDALSFIESLSLGGHGKGATPFFEYLLNGRALSEMVPVADKVGLFGSPDRNQERLFARQFLGRTASDFPSGRVPLYVCPLCADPGCGAVTVRVTAYVDCYVWSEFGEEYPYVAGPVLSFVDVRDFCFQRRAYEHELERFC